MKRFPIPLSFVIPSLLLALLLAACAGSAEPTVAPQPAQAEPTEAPAEQPDEAGVTSGTRTFVIIPEESRASYIVSEEFFQDALQKLGIEAGKVEVRGSTQEIEGQLELDLTDLSAPLGTNRFTVDMTTLSTDQSQRDKWIRENGPEFNAYPTAAFMATAVEEAPDTYQQGEEVQFKLAGDLTVREVTRPVVFDVTATLDGDTITGIARTDLLLTDFGIEPPDFVNTLSVANEFAIEVELTAREQ